MDSAREFIQDNKYYIATGVVLLGSTWILTKRFRKRTRVCGVDYPKDKVILHVFPRDTARIPSMGHFVMKLETYLRIHKIPFQLDFNFAGGPKNKTPWIEYNGVTMGDSQLIMQYFNKTFNVDMNSHLSKEERAIAWAIQKWLEEYTYWLNVHTRWSIFFEDMLTQILNVSRWVVSFMKIVRKPKIERTTYTVGIGRHSDEEVHKMMVNDLRMFADILGTKKYIMGDKVTETDCAAFGVLSQIRWCTPESDPGHQLLTSGELKNVIDYLDRIKDTYWMDWEDILAAVKK